MRVARVNTRPHLSRPVIATLLPNTVSALLYAYIEEEKRQIYCLCLRYCYDQISVSLSLPHVH